MKRGLSMRKKEMINGLLFITPWLIGFLVFFAYNFAQAIHFSLSNVVIIPEGGFYLEWMGLSNFKYAFLSHATFNRQLVTSLQNTLIDVPMITFFSLFMALLLNRKFALRGLVRAIFFLPVILATSSVTQALDAVLRMMMNGVSNISQEFMQSQSMSGINPTAIAMTLANFGIPLQVITYIITAANRIYTTITASGVQILIFLAALQAIPSSLYEVAKIEGATAYETFWKITFPMVSPLILTNVIYTIVDTYSNSEVVKMAHTVAFNQQNFGLSAAMSIISAAVTCLVLLILGVIISRNVFYQN